jgi:hypothetical protein
MDLYYEEDIEKQRFFQQLNDRNKVKIPKNIPASKKKK